MADKDVRLESLTIYLAKQGLEAPSSAVANIPSLKQFELKDDRGSLGTLYVQAHRSKPPKWGSFFVPQLKLADLGYVSYTAAVLHTIVDNRAFLLGQGRHVLEQASYEERFGLRVTLNSIGEGRVRSIDKHTLDTIGRHTRVQASKEATAGEFGLDIEQDLLRAITGTPDDETLGRTLSGLDSLHVVARVTLDSLRSLLSRYLHQFFQDTYKRTFPWVDHIADVKEPLMKERLDSLLLETIRDGRSDKCWLAVPEPIEWARTAGFRYGGGTRHATYHDIHLVEFLTENGIDSGSVTIDFLKGHKVSAVDGDGMAIYRWTGYRCIYCETEDGADTYFLSGGRWYKVASDFVRQVNEFYQRIPRYETELPVFSDDSETSYNQRVATDDRATYALMDRKLIPIGGGYGKVEFCDLFTRKNDLIHVKRYGSAGVLSHLFAQGVVSGQSFVSDAAFREAVNDQLPPPYRLHDCRPRPSADGYRVVFAIISRETGTALTLPFFSRLNARHAIQTLEGYGYKTVLAKIQVDDSFTRIKKYTKTRRKS
jgi:uncharacterized protein (TIGR04141 family)